MIRFQKNSVKPFYRYTEKRKKSIFTLKLHRDRWWENSCRLVFKIARKKYTLLSWQRNMILSSILTLLNSGLIMVIELSGVHLVWNHTRDFKIERAHSASSIWNHGYDFRPKLHDMKLYYIHFKTTHFFFLICIGPQGWL